MKNIEIDKTLSSMEIELKKYKVEYKKVGWIFKTNSFIIYYDGESKFNCYTSYFRYYFGSFHIRKAKKIACLGNVFEKHMLIKQFQILDIDIKNILCMLMLEV